MRDDEPLEGWLLRVPIEAKRGLSPYDQGVSREALDRLAQALVTQPEGKVNYDRIPGRLPNIDANTAYSAAEAAEAQQLFLQVWERGGAGSTHIVEGLLQSVALARQPASVPFWRQVLDLSRPRDQTAKKRRIMALAALALLAITRDDADAYATLAEALTHPHEQVRALGAFYLARAYAVPRRPLPAPVASALGALATRDGVFAPRFQARAALRTLGCPVPHDDPELVYLLKVQLRGNRATRTIAVRPAHTLSNLHYTIQQAFDWDSDHLYSFHMSGVRGDRLYEIRCPELDDGWGFASWLMVSEVQDESARGEQLLADAEAFDDAEDEEGEEDAEDEDEDDGSLYTTNARIGALGLVPKHQFIYFFDYGDSHEFAVTVLKIEARADDGAYPQVIEARGQAPQQYHSYEDEEDDEE
jgi:hypothetical protein